MITPTNSGLTFYDSTPGLTVPPIPITAYSALSMPAYFRAISFLSETLSSLPRSVTLKGAKAETPHPLDKLLERRPNRYQNATMAFRTLFFAAAHYANGYMRIERDPTTFAPIALHNLPPENMLPFRYDDGKGEGPLQYFADIATRKVYNGQDVIHLAGMSYCGMRGIDAVALHTGTIQRAGTLDRFMTKFLQKGTNLKASVEFQGDVTPEKFEQVRTMLRDRFTGIDATDDVLLLGNGAQLKNATLSPQSSQLVEQQALSTKQIAQMTGVDPAFMFDRSESKYANIEDAGQNVVRYTLRPWIEQAEDEFSLKLLSDAELDQGHWVNIDPDALLRGDTKAQTSNAIAKKNAGMTTANEARDELGLPKSDDVDADKLKTLGDTAPTPASPPATPPAGD